MAQEFDIVRAHNLPAASSVSDSDMLLVVQGINVKRVPPSLMKGKTGDPGPGAFLGVTATYIVWKQGAKGSWNNLFEIERLRGPRGEKPEFRKINGCLMMKYEGQPDSAFVKIFDREELKLKFSELTPAEVDLLKLHFTDLTEADKAELMKPATDAAAEVRKDMGEIKTEAIQLQEKIIADADKVNTDLTAAVGALEKRAEVVISETNTAKVAAETATANTNEAIRKAAEATGVALAAAGTVDAAKQAALTAATLAVEKAGIAEEQAAEAKKQGEFAKQQADRAAGLNNRVIALERDKVDGGYAEEGMLQLTSQGLPIGDPIEVGSGTGGGGGGGITCKVKAITETLLSTVSGASVRIGYNFTSVYADDGSETGEGTATYTINSQKVATEAIQQGNVYFDATKYLIVGTNTIKVTVKDTTGQSRSVVYTVEVISMSIASSYDPTQVNADTITYKYTPTGAISKTVHFVLDGKEIGTEVTDVSNRQLSYVIPKQTHGAHRLVVYMTATVNSVEVRSNELAHDLICVVSGNNTVIVSSSFNQVAAQQYDKLAIPFVVYNPPASMAPVVLSVNGVTLSELTVDRTAQVWNYRIPQQGALVLKIASGNVSRTFNLDVSPADVVVEAETADLALFLTAQNRSNNDNNRGEWKYNTISAALTGFNFKTNGWITTDGSTALRVSGDARASIPFKIFDNDFRSTGKTIEFEFATRDVVDYAATVISCMTGNIGLKVTAQEALFKSEQTTVDTRFKEDERVRVSFVIEKKTDHRLIYIYLNGIMSGVVQYPVEDNFQQEAPVNISIGSNDCTIDIYTIRIYDNNLTQYQVLNNFIADIDDYDRKMEIYERNQVYDEYGNISYAKVLEKIPCMILEGVLPTYKGDKKTNKVYHSDLQEPTRSFECLNVQNDVQGTSSQYYPRKNYKYKFKADITYTDSAASSPTYALRADSIPVNCFCLKADFAESSGTHNTGMAKLADRLLKNMGILTPPQLVDDRVRTTIDGYPICVFHRETPSAPPSFLGKYNFNNDKSTVETFGFEDGDESWEFLNNTSDRVIFKSADFSTDDWQNDFEARHPDGGMDCTNLKAVCEWIVSTKDKPAKFKDEVAEHFVVDNLLVYYLITELFGMVDQRAKNMFLTHYHGDVSEAGNKLWRFIIYDSDTQSGINNEGARVFGYNIEYHDTIGSQNVWNGEQSVLWKNVEESFAAEMADIYRDIRSKGFLSYNAVMDIYNDEQSDKWCEAIYNADSQFKYIDPLINDGNGSYLYAAQGSRAEHRKWWLHNRFLYMDSKYNAGDFLSDFATMRLYTPKNWAGVAPNADVTITPFADSYVRVKYGSYIVGLRCQKGVPVTIEAPDIEFNDTETIVYGASRIKSLGDLSGLYAGTIDMSKATRLAVLQIGSAVEGYHNDNLTVLAIGSNKMLRMLGIQNCPNLKQAVDVAGCENIEEFYAQGTEITAAVLPPAGILSKLYLPATVTNLTLKSQPKLLDAFFELAGVGKLTTVVYENTPINVFALIDRCLSIMAPVLSRVRLIDIDGRGANLDTLYKLTKAGGIDEKGNNVPKAVVTGKFHAVTAVEDKLTVIRAAFPELTVTYTNLKDPTVTTISFSSSRYKSITNATFECNFEFVKVSETTYKVTADDDSTIEFTFGCDNHIDYSGSYFVAGSRSVSYTVTYIPLRKIHVKVYDQSVYVSGARVTIGEDVYVTDKDGYVTIKRGGEAVSGTVTAAGYAGNTFSFSAITDDVTNSVDVYAAVEVKFIVKNGANELVQGATITCDGRFGTTNVYGECTVLVGKGEHEYTFSHPDYIDDTGTITVGISTMTVYVHTSVWVKFIVKNNSSLILQGATVTCEEKTATTNADGECSIMLKKGTKDYTVSCYSHFDVSGTVTVGTSDIIKNVSMEINIEDLKPEENGNIQLMLVGTAATLNVTSTTTDYVINWGDGTTENASGTGVKAYNHTYSDGGYYQVEVSNCAEVTSCNGTQYNTIAYWSIGDSKVSGLLFVNYSKIEYIGDLWKNDANRTSLFEFCRDCSRLKYINLASFANNSSVTNLNSFLYNCNGLTTIDLTPLAGMVGVADLNDFLVSCYATKTIVLGWQTPLPASSNILSGTGSGPIYTPDASVELYKTATNWSKHATRYKPISEKPTE